MGLLAEERGATGHSWPGLSGGQVLLAGEVFSLFSTSPALSSAPHLFAGRHIGAAGQQCDLVRWRRQARCRAAASAELLSCTQACRRSTARACRQRHAHKAAVDVESRHLSVDPGHLLQPLACDRLEPIAACGHLLRPRPTPSRALTSLEQCRSELVRRNKMGRDSAHVRRDETLPCKMRLTVVERLSLVQGSAREAAAREDGGRERSCYLQTAHIASPVRKCGFDLLKSVQR